MSYKDDATLENLNSDENLINLFEVDREHYLYAYNRLAERYPEMKEFVFPQYHIQDKNQDYNFRTVFNCMLNAFKKMLTNCPYLCRLTGFKPNNLPHKCEVDGVKLIPILDEYAVQEKEANDPMKLNLIYFNDGLNYHDETLPYFTKFAKTLENRHKTLYNIGIISEPFKASKDYMEVNNYLNEMYDNLVYDNKRKKVELDRELS